MSQLTHPRKATLRTAFASAVVLVPCYVVVIPVILDSMGEYLPEGARAWLAASVVFVTALIAAVTRIMALPAVNDALTALGLGVAPKGTDTPVGRHEAPQAPGDPQETLF